MARLLLGVSGGIAAYKTVSLMRLLQKSGHEVRVVMTPNAANFVTPLTFQALTPYPVMLEEFNPGAQSTEQALTHIDSAKWAELIVIAPATANTIAKMAAGIADNLLTSLVLAATCRVAVFPAMNNNMYRHPATQANLKTLASRGIIVADAATGALACGDCAEGRMPEPEEITKYLNSLLSVNQNYKGLKVLVTAGPTIEQIDPVRYISNHSSGKMGYAIAEALKTHGADVTLISGAVALNAPVENVVHVRSAADMLTAARLHINDCDMLIMTAAVADYTPETVHSQKIKKEAAEVPNIKLVKTPDILKELGKNKRQGQVFVGFAAESEKLLEHASEKLKSKNLDMIVANDISRNDIGFGSDYNEVTLVFKDSSETVPKANKREIAEAVLKKALEIYKQKKS